VKSDGCRPQTIESERVPVQLPKGTEILAGVRGCTHAPAGSPERFGLGHRALANRCSRDHFFCRRAKKHDGRGDHRRAWAFMVGHRNRGCLVRGIMDFSCPPSRMFTAEYRTKDAKLDCGDVVGSPICLVRAATELHHGVHHHSCRECRQTNDAMVVAMVEVWVDESDGLLAGVAEFWGSLAHLARNRQGHPGDSILHWHHIPRFCDAPWGCACLSDEPDDRQSR